MFLKNNFKIYNFNELNNDILLDIFNNIEMVYKLEQRKKISYYNVECSFDVETTSTYINDEKIAFIYEWTFGVGESIVYGRNIEEFVNLLTNIRNILKIKENNYFVIYVHNLSFEYQFIKNYFEIIKSFFLKEREIIYFRTFGFEFRCSYLESGKSLEKIGEEIGVDKKVGDLDYKKVRHYETKLTKKELDYCLYDVIILLKYIKNKINELGDITKIQLTKTAYVRKMCRDNCLNDAKYKKYIKYLKVGVEEYYYLKNCFSGGFTHANYLHTDCVLENVFSFDFESSYPSVMLSEQFPASSARRVVVNNDNEFWYYLSEKCCLFGIRLYNVKSKEKGDNIISLSKCIDAKNYVVDNGRIKQADEITIICNEIDFIDFCNFYDFEYELRGEFYVYNKGYLPKRIIEVVVELYKKKTELKGIKGKELEYKKAKERLNAIYGMMVMDIVRSDENIEEQIKQYNFSRTRFNFYAWGVWISSYARHNLYTGILECGDDYVYSDTDSIKLLNLENHIEYFEKYNKKINDKISECLNNFGIKEKLEKLGVWDREEDIKKFKTLGAKRYLCGYENCIKLTCAGLDKTKGVEYLEKFKDPFEKFSDGLVVPKKFSGKMTHTYIDYEMNGIIKDYKGNELKINAKSGIHLEECEFSLNMDDMYIKLLQGIKDDSMII